MSNNINDFLPDLFGFFEDLVYVWFAIHKGELKVPFGITLLVDKKVSTRTFDHHQVGDQLDSGAQIISVTSGQQKTRRMVLVQPWTSTTASKIDYEWDTDGILINSIETVTPL